ncbi:MAG: DUF2436 domain-containing protein, partial [Prevotella sp.]|nr:DUF2436 domain-containing protein [Prevotella sp.]
WDVAYKADGDSDFTIVEGITSNPYTLTGLQQDTHYTVKVRGNCGGGNVSNWSAEVVFRTDVAFHAPKNLTAADVTPHTATITWRRNTGAQSYKLRYKKIDAPTMTMIMLKADYVWGDGTGYQMLFDADATAYDDVIPALDSSEGYLADASVYDQFEYKIPENADGELTTQNIILDDSLSLMIPAGSYDWCITNPTPGDRLWMASSYGSIPGRTDDYVFEAGRQYTFHAYKHSSGHDAIDLTISLSPEALLTGSTGEWTVVNNVTSPYTVAGLDTESFYVVQVQAVYADGESQWSATAIETPKENPIPFDVVVTPGATSADIAWNGFGDSYNVKYRRAEGRKTYFYEDFENGLTGWTVVRNGNGDENFDWHVGTTSDAVSGSVVAVSFSWDGSSSYDVDNWLITPSVKLDGTLSFWVRDDGQYHDHFDVYVSTSTNEIDQFTLLYEPGYANGSWNEITVDLSSYNGARGYIAIRHQENDQHYILIDDFGIYGDSVSVGNWTTVNTADKSLTITGLEAATPYEYQIQSVKDGSTTEWTPLDVFYTRANKMPGDVNDDARISIADVTETVNLIKTHGYDAAADLDNDNDVDNDDLAKLVYVGVLGYSSVPGSGGGVLSAPRRQAPMSAPKAAIKPINFSVKKGVEDIKQQKLYRTK